MAKNVLFIGPYRQGLDGWNIAAREYIRALVKTGVNLTIRPIYMGQGVSEPPLEFLELEENKLPYYDVVIQNVLPHLAEYNGNYGKNIALFYTESCGWHNTWVSRLSCMDEVWVPSFADSNNLTLSGYDKDIREVPIPTDVGKFVKSYESDQLHNILDSDSFKFYFIGELIQRKCLDRLVQAFHIEFDPLENVELVVKTSKSGLAPEQVVKMFNDYVTTIKTNLRLHGRIDQYKEELCITGKLTEDELCYLHSRSNCFVMPSMGESWSMPVLDAAGFGKTPIVIRDTGPNAIIDENSGWVVPSFLDHVNVMDAPLPDIYTGYELWHNYSLKNLCKAMRSAFEDKDTFKSDNCIEKAFEYSYEKVAMFMKELI